MTEAEKEARGVPGFAERENRATRAWEFFANDDRAMSHDFRGGYHQGLIDGFDLGAHAVNVGGSPVRLQSPGEVKAHTQAGVEGVENSPQNSEHTAPTDDDREALAQVLLAWAGPWEGPRKPSLLELLLDAGFRRGAPAEPAKPCGEKHPITGAPRGARDE